MALNQAQIDGDAARAKVRARWPDATSCYTGATAAQVYDAATGAVLGESQESEFAVDHAWIAAARSGDGDSTIDTKEAVRA